MDQYRVIDFKPAQTEAPTLYGIELRGDSQAQPTQTEVELFLRQLSAILTRVYKEEGEQDER